LKSVLTKYDEFRASVANPASFLYHKFIAYDFLIINGLVIFSLILMLRSMKDRLFEYRLEWLWVLLGAGGLYAASLYLRTEPGTVFGNRMLMPLAPLVLFCSALGLRNREESALFKVIGGFVFTLMLAGALQPWETPSPLFLKLNSVLSTALGLLAAVFIFSKRIRHLINPICALLTKRPIAFVCVFMLCLFQAGLIRGS